MSSKIKEILKHTNMAGEVYLCDVRKAIPNSTVQQAREISELLTEIKKEALSVNLGPLNADQGRK